MSNVDIWEQEIREKDKKLHDLFPKGERETRVMYFEDPWCGAEHYIFRIGEINEDIWTDEICWIFGDLSQYIAEYWAASGIENGNNFNKEQFRIISSIARIVGVKFFSNTMYVLVVDGWDQEIIDKTAELWAGRMSPITKDERGIATWYIFEITDDWIEDYSDLD